MFSEVIKAFLALKMTVECLALEAQWCKSNGILVSCLVNVEALKILQMGGWSALEHWTQGTEAKKPRMLCIFAGKWSLLLWRDGTPWICREGRIYESQNSYHFDFPPSECNNQPQMAEVSKNKIPTCEGGSFTVCKNSPLVSVSCFLMRIHLLSC